MAKRLHLVRRSLFEEFGDENNDTSSVPEKSSNYYKNSTIIPLKMNSALVACVAIGAISVATLSNDLTRGILRKTSEEFLVKAHSSSDWVQMNYQDLLGPAFYGTLMSIFTMFIVYYDSDVPGLNPPAPFSPRKANQIRYAVHMEKTNHLSYLVSVASGIITFFILYL